MKRKDIETKLKQLNIKQIDLIINQTDNLAIYCIMKNNTLYDYNNHVIDRKKDIWGYLKWENGKSSRVAW